MSNPVGREAGGPGSEDRHGDQSKPHGEEIGRPFEPGRMPTRRPGIPASQANLHEGPYFIMGKRVGAPDSRSGAGNDIEAGADEPEQKGVDHPAPRD